LHVTQATGGVETNLALVLRHLDRSRFELELACPPGAASLIGHARALGLGVHEVPMVRSANPISDSLALTSLVRLLRRERFAIVHGHSAKGGYLARVAARLAGSPKTFYHPQAFSYLSQRGLARAFFLRLERLAVPLTDRVVAASESERRRAVEEVHFPEHRVTVIPNSVDFAELNGGSPASSTNTRLVLTAARLSYQKNPEMFVRTAKRIADRRSDVRFVMLGGGFAGPLEGKIRRMIADSGLERRVEILPWGTRPQTLKLIAECDVFVLTSRFEGMPNTLLEALMLSRPAVVTDVDGSRDILEGGVGGFLVPPDDDEAMATRILQLLDDPAGAGEVARLGHGRVRQRFDARPNVAALGREYERVLAI
jgi:glycosyltransferase involved in cell wall biosynthesis